MAVISGGGTIGNRYAYDPYGRVLSSTGNVANPFGYAGGYLDSTGLVKFGATYYDPNLGRWTQQDAFGGSVANPSALNGYVYVGCNPNNSVDRSGAWSENLPHCTLGLVAGGVGIGGGAALFLGGAGELSGAAATAWEGAETVMGPVSFLSGIHNIGLGTATAGVGAWGSWAGLIVNNFRRQWCQSHDMRSPAKRRSSKTYIRQRWRCGSR